MPARDVAQRVSKARRGRRLSVAGTNGSWFCILSSSRFPGRYFCYVAIGEEIRVWLEEHVGFVCSLDNLLIMYSLIIINENLSLRLCPSLSLCIA